VFLGRFNRGMRTYHSPYSDRNVYWLTYEGPPGLRMAEVDGRPYGEDAGPEAYRATVHFEEDRSFYRLKAVRDEGSDHWFWRRVTAGNTDTLRSQLRDPLPTDASARVRVGLHGLTSSGLSRSSHCAPAERVSHR